jgi:hypothetical protein
MEMLFHAISFGAYELMPSEAKVGYERLKTICSSIGVTIS